MTKATKKIKVGVVDDSPLMRRMIMEAVNADEGLEVVGEASNPLEAREMIKTRDIDIITLDVEMPKMNGIDFLEKIMKLRPMPVIMVSTLTHDGAETTLRALEIGAVDYVGKPLGQGESFKEFRLAIVDKIKGAMGARVSSAAAAKAAPASVSKATSKIIGSSPQSLAGTSGKKFSLIAIGASTGGVERLRRVFEHLPQHLPPVIVVQHMTPQFIPSFAQRLNSLSKLEVSVPVNDEVLRPGHAYVASNLAHLEIKGAHPGPYRARLTDKPPVSGHKASVDVMFDSVAQHAGDHAFGVILTGMGHDGADGMKKMFDAGAYTIGESEQSCLIYGMPRCAKEKGGIRVEMSLDEIIAEISKLASS